MDIDPNTPNATQIDTLDDLKATVTAAAALQLIYNEAEAACQAAIEAAEAKFREATASIVKDLSNHFAGVYQFAGKNKDLLFPKLGKKQVKTIKISGHELCYKLTPPALETPLDCEGLTTKEEKKAASDAFYLRLKDLVQGIINEADARHRAGDSAEEIKHLEDLATLLESCCTHPTPFVNVSALKAAWESLPDKVRQDLGLKMTQEDRFSLAFNFRPDSHP